MKDRLTQFGLKCRELRARFNLTMGDQAKSLSISVAYISAIERGKRTVPEDFPLEVAQWMSLSESDTQTLRDLASGERTVVKVFPTNSDRALLAEDFARDLNGLSAVGVRQLRLVLESCRSGKYSDREIRERASLVRAALALGEQLTFDILRIIENHLATIDPNFSLQVDPDGSLGEHLHIYSDSDGKTVNRLRSTEWLYNAAAQGTADSRFKLAHELAHWILHRHETHAFLRFSRPGKIVSKNIQVEYEADFFARELLMPLALVENFSEPKLLARAVQVPLWAAQKRIREISLLSRPEREEIRQFAAAARAKIQSQSGNAELITSSSQEVLIPRTESTFGATVLKFPKKLAARARFPIKHKRKESADLPLFDYADATQSGISQPLINRSDQWFADFGWRG